MEYRCSRCKKPIPEEVHRFSRRNYFKSLCKEHQPTDKARILGNALIKRGWFIKFQQSDGHKHIDIAVLKARTNIEVDGCHHNLNKKQALADLQRTYYSFKKGFLTLRIPNSLLKDNKTIKETVKFIDKFLKENKKSIKKWKKEQKSIWFWMN